MYAHFSPQRSSRLFVFCLICLFGIGWTAIAVPPVTPVPLATDSGVLSQSSLPRPQEESIGAAAQDSFTDDRLLGEWEHRSEQVILSLLVLSEDLLDFSGRRLRYTLTPGVLHIEGDSGSVDYAYEIRGGALELRLTDGDHDHHMVFRRVNASQQ